MREMPGGIRYGLSEALRQGDTEEARSVTVGALEEGVDALEIIKQVLGVSV